MLKPKYIIPALILAAVLLVAEIMIIRSAVEYEPKVEAVYAAEKIAKGTIITENMLKTRSIDMNVTHRLSFRKTGDVIGKAARMDIEQDEMLLSSKVEEPGNINAIPVLNPEARLFSVELKGDQANGWQLKTGDHVDIIFIPQRTEWRSAENLNGEIKPERPQGSTVRLENVRIAALVDDSGNVIDDVGKGDSPKYIIFEVEKGRDEFLAYAKANGRLELSVIPD
jgi:Flp pilus assembly protein CpaB